MRRKKLGTMLQYTLKINAFKKNISQYAFNSGIMSAYFISKQKKDTYLPYLMDFK